MMNNRKKIEEGIGMCVIYFLLIFLIIGGLIGTMSLMSEYRDKDYEKLEREYVLLEMENFNCEYESRLLTDPKCYRATDCIRNNNLTGCKKFDCNWACCDDSFPFCETTLMGCGGFYNSTFSNESNLTEDVWATWDQNKK